MDNAPPAKIDESPRFCRVSSICGHLQRAMRKARKSMDENRYDDAVNHFTAAYGVAQRPADQIAALCGRAEAYIRLCRSILSRPARESEERALFALEPSSYAALALQDSDAVLRLGDRNATACTLKGTALLLLERYNCAQTTLMHALFLDPSNAPAQEALAAVQAALDAAADAPGNVLAGGGSGKTLGRASACSQRQLQLEQCDDLECILCMRLLYEPVTTPCGHSFCKPCFARCTDIKNRCPVCRTVLHVGRELPVSVTLKRILERSFPEEYAARQQEECGGGECSGGDEETPLPLFVMSALLPGERMGLQIFEPRYRLMVRRCMEGSRRFGMAVRLEGSEEVEPLATEAEITECTLMPDGRFHLEIVGRRRCRLQRTWEQDGYRMGVPRYFCDDPLPCPQSPEGEALAAREASLLEDTTKWVEHLKAASQARRAYRALELLYRAGNQPPLCHPVPFSFWAAALLPTLDSNLRMELMDCCNTHARLTRVQQHLQGAIDSFSAEGCSVM